VCEGGRSKASTRKESRAKTNNRLKTCGCQPDDLESRTHVPVKGIREVGAVVRKLKAGGGIFSATGEEGRLQAKEKHHAGVLSGGEEDEGRKRRRGDRISKGERRTSSALVRRQSPPSKWVGSTNRKVRESGEVSGEIGKSVTLTVVVGPKKEEKQTTQKK